MILDNRNKINSTCKRSEPTGEPSNKKIRTQTSQSDKSNVGEDDVPSNKANIKEYISRRIRQYVETYFIKQSVDTFSKESAQNILNELKNVEIMVNDEDTVKIRCFKCTHVSCAYYVRKNKYCKGWTLSNFNKHLKTHFQCKQKQTKSTSSSLSIQKKMVNSTLETFLKIKTTDSNTPQPKDSSDNISNASSSQDLPLSSSPFDRNLSYSKNYIDDLDLFFCKGRTINKANSSAISEKPSKPKTQKNLRFTDQFHHNQFKITIIPNS